MRKHTGPRKHPSPKSDQWPQTSTEAIHGSTTKPYSLTGWEILNYDQYLAMLYEYEKCISGTNARLANGESLSAEEMDMDAPFNLIQKVTLREDQL
jgi:hypothetical protein